MYRNKINGIQLLLISLIWVLLFAIPLLFGESSRGFNWHHIFKIWQEYSFLFLIFLANRFLLMPYLFLKGKRIQYFLVISLLIFSLTSGVFVLEHHRKRQRSEFLSLPAQPGRPGGRPPVMRSPGRKFVPPYVDLAVMGILLIGFDSGLLFFSKWMQSEQNKLKAEKESVVNKMAFLQNQVSPHFFMNTLNNIHALIDIDSEEAKDAIIRLSRMMDYMLYESQTPKISLKQEMDFIAAYIELMKLRLTDDVELVFDIPSTFPRVKIPPLLTISFIENAFKYGVSYEQPSFIHIHINVSERKFNFKAVNKIHPGKQRTKGTGIGIENARKRLSLIYGNNYELTIHHDDHKFEVNLIIPL